MTIPSNPSGDAISVIPEDVRAIGRYAYETAESLRSALTSTGGAVQSLLEADWNGPAATGFGTGWQECHDGGMALLQTLTEMAEKLGVNAASYQGQDDATATTVGTTAWPVNV